MRGSSYRLTALVEGTGANSITLVGSGTGISVTGSHLGIGGGTTSGVNAIKAVGHATLSGGSDTFGVVISGHAVSVPYDTSDDQTAIDLVAAIIANATVAAIVTATHGSSGVVVLTAVTAGTVGNAVTFTVTGTGASANGAGFLGGTTSGANAIAATGKSTIASGSGNELGVVIGGYAATVPWATSDAATATALIVAINANPNTSFLVTASDGGSGVVLMTAKTAGTSGNAITLTVYSTGVTVSASAMAGGAMAYDTVVFGTGASTPGAQMGANINGTVVTVPWTTSHGHTGDLFAAAVAANATTNAMVSAVNSIGTVTLTSKIDGSAPDAWTLAAVGGGHNATNLVLTATSGLVFKATAYA